MADTRSVNRRLARGQLHRLVRWLGVAARQGSGVNHGNHQSHRCRLRRICWPRQAMIKPTNRPLAGKTSHGHSSRAETVRIRRQTIRSTKAPMMAPKNKRTMTSKRSDRGSKLIAWSHHLTSRKISCREPSVHVTQHTLPTGDTGSVNRRLARGQLHRPVRCLGCAHTLRKIKAATAASVQTIRRRRGDQPAE